MSYMTVVDLYAGDRNNGGCGSAGYSKWAQQGRATWPLGSHSGQWIARPDQIIPMVSFWAGTSVAYISPWAVRAGRPIDPGTRLFRGIRISPRSYHEQPSINPLLQLDNAVNLVPLLMVTTEMLHWLRLLVITAVYVLEESLENTR